MRRMTQPQHFHGTTDLARSVELRRTAILERLERAGGTNVRVFGSLTRGEDGPTSDVDLLVDFRSTLSLFELAQIEEELSDLVGTRVDVVDAGHLRPHLRTRVLEEAVAV